MSIADEKEVQFRERYHEYTRTLDCVHCGLCIPHCPTYDLTLRESDSPRGRIYLMRQYAEGQLELSQNVVRHLDQCIVCRACETACPSGIRMGDMMESFREEQQKRSIATPMRTRLGRFLLRQVLPRRSRIALLSDLIYLYQASGLRRLANFLARRVLKHEGLVYLQRLEPTIPPWRERRIETDETRPDGYPAEGNARMRVGLFLGCIAAEWFAPVHRATIRVLQKNGCDVIVPHAQTCCGALHRHVGLLTDGAELLRKNAAAFKESGVDVVVVNAAGCGAAMKEPPRPSSRGTSEGENLGVPVRDICEFLDEVGMVPPAGRVEKSVVYDQPCHLLHGQQIGGEVVENLLSAIPGLRLLPLQDSDKCCGSGGVYNLLERELAEPLGEQKSTSIKATGADIVVTGNPGCAMQIRAALRETEVEVLHPIELLDRSYSLAD